MRMLNRVRKISVFINASNTRGYSIVAAGYIPPCNEAEIGCWSINGTQHTRGVKGTHFGLKCAQRARGESDRLTLTPQMTDD
jgi:hypothetical protein